MNKWKTFRQEYMNEWKGQFEREYMCDVSRFTTFKPGDVLRPNTQGIGHQINANIRITIVGEMTHHTDDKGGRWNGDFYKIIPVKVSEHETIGFLEKEVAFKFYELDSRSEIATILYGEV